MKPTAAQRRRWSRIADLGCLICRGPATIHHCGTGGGGRKCHDRVAPLCVFHHIGPEGIDGKRMSKREWQRRYMTEADMLAQVASELGE